MAFRLSIRMYAAVKGSMVSDLYPRLTRVG